MIDITLANLRNGADFFKSDEVLHVFDGRKKEEIGYFVPKKLSKEFGTFLDALEKKKKRALLERVADAQKSDPIEEGAVNDGVE